MGDIEEPEKIAPFVCGSCGHTWMISLEPDLSECPRCGACVECV